MRICTYRIYVNTKRPKNKEEIHDIYAFPHIFNKKFIFCRCVEIMHSAEFTYFSFFWYPLLLLLLSVFLLVNQMDERPLQEKLFQFPGRLLFIFLLQQGQAASDPHAGVQKRL